MTVDAESGYTPSERYLGKLCRASFLTLWSYPNPFTDRGSSAKNRQGKELCDLLVVFDNNIIIFSDNSCKFGDSGSISVDWRRWYKRAIESSAKQIYGAERWLADYPDRIFVDRLCEKPFPLHLQSPSERKIHRIIVALGAEERCASFFGGGSRGSLVHVPSIVGDQHLSDAIPAGPFRIGRPFPNKGFVHVLDEANLDIVMSEVNTISDFVTYLKAKENFYIEGKLFTSHGEEETLAFYQSKLVSPEGPSFSLPPEALEDKGMSVVIGEGLWDEYIVSELYVFKEKLQQASAFFDMLIESISTSFIGRKLGELSG